MFSDHLPNNDQNKGERTQKLRQTGNGVQAHSTIGKGGVPKAVEIVVAFG
jgi:hypothetical protein